MNNLTIIISIIIIVGVMAALGTFAYSHWQQNLEVWQENRELKETIAGYKTSLEFTLEELKEYKLKNTVWLMFYGQTGWDYIMGMLEEANIDPSHEVYKVFDYK